jgi:hypothetical protein
MLKELLSIWIGTAAPSSSSCAENSSIVDSTLPVEDTVELSPNSPFEVLDTNDCTKVRLPGEVPVEILEAHVRHHFSGRGEIPLSYLLGV